MLRPLLIILAVVFVIGVVLVITGPPVERRAMRPLSKAECQENLRHFQLTVRVMQKGESAEFLEALTEKLEAERLGAGYVARTETELVAHGCD